MPKLTKTEEYALAISDAILSLFKKEENINLYHLELETLDATKFITAMVMGCNVVFQKLTKEEKNNVEFTHLCNSLIIQDLIEDKKRK